MNYLAENIKRSPDGTKGVVAYRPPNPSTFRLTEWTLHPAYWDQRILRLGL